MKQKDIKTLISYRMDRSKESIHAAEIMFEKGMLAFSMNRIYYAMFYAVQALLALKDTSFSKHGQVKGYFNHEFIKTGIFSIEMGKLYNKTFEYRQKFDYVDFVVPEHDMVYEYIEKAMEFYRKIDEYIQAQQ
ncbi:MAG: HEPN domain-containing protein [bacterium]|nr:HEPN domain-containing protein [bacterium]